MSSAMSTSQPGVFKTSVGFLDRLQAEFGESWYRLNEIYGPLIRGWLRRQGINGSDADDIAQDVLLVVQQKISEFERQRLGSFRNWLRQITVNCLRDFRRKNWKPASAPGGDVSELLNNLEDPKSRLCHLWDREHDAHVLRFAMQEVKPHFSPQTWQAFYAHVVQQQSPTAIAAELGISENAVYIAKSRVSKRVKKVIQGLLN